MAKRKIAITLDDDIVRRIDTFVREQSHPSRSKTVKQAVREKLSRLERSRLTREASKLFSL
jgi:metal-responsive CopG/Arc/MetJ family transcriptional regulator